MKEEKPGRSMGLGRVLWVIPAILAVLTGAGCAGVSSTLEDMSTFLPPGVAATGQALPPVPGTSG